MKILIVEDENLIRLTLAKLLSVKGADVECAITGREAIELINKHHFDRIICDLMLKDITGFDVIEESKSKYTLAEIQKKFVIITAYSSPEVLEKVESYGCRFFGKPFKDLGKTIEALTEKL